MQGLNSVQLSEWEAYDQLDPIGEWRNDFRFADLETLLLNLQLMTHSDPKKPKPKLATISMFMPKWGVPNKLKRRHAVKQSVQDMRATMMGIADDQNKWVRKQSKHPKQ